MPHNTPEKYRAYLAKPEVQDRIAAACRRRYAINKEKKLKQKQNYYRKNRDKIAVATLKRKFGISPWTHNNMADWQGFTCAVCRDVVEDSDGKGRTLHVDHCHNSGVVRGLLCSNCNTMIGLADDSIERLESAISYLKFNRTLVVLLATVIHFRKCD